MFQEVDLRKFCTYECIGVERSVRGKKKNARHVINMNTAVFD